MKLRLLLLSLLSAVITAVALPNDVFSNGSPLFGLFCLSFYFYAVSHTRTAGSAALLGALYGGISTLLSNYWLMFFGEFSVWTLGGTTLGYVGYHALLATFMRRISESPRYWRPFALAALWTAYEYLKSMGFLGYPWGLAAYPFSGVLPFIQIADVTGVWGVSFIVALANALIAELLPNLGSRTDRIPSGTLTRTLLLRQAVMVVLLWTAAFGYGFVQLSRPLRVSHHMYASLIQQNTDSWITGDEAATLHTAQTLSRQALAAAPQSDVLVWSETSLRRPFSEYLSYYTHEPPEDPFVPFVASLPVPLLTGAPYIINPDTWDAMNAVIMLTGAGNVEQYYGKQQLVPFAENIPFWDIPAVREFFRTAVGLQGTWTAGTQYRLFPIKLSDGSTIPAGTPICFEDAFPYLGRGFVRAGAGVLINLTNNSWSKRNSAQIQHFVAARFRAVENRISLVRSTNSGLTALVDGYGRITAQAPMFTQTYLNVNAPIYTHRWTVYTTYGDYVPYAVMLIVFGVLVCLAMEERLGRRTPGTLGRQ